MSLLNTFFLGVTNSFNATIELNINSIVVNDPDYNFSGTYVQNPINKKIVNVFTSGIEHVMDVNKKLMGNISTDEGLTRGADFTIYDPGATGVQVGSGGYDKNGRLHLFVYQRDNVDYEIATIDQLVYIYSDDDGVTISSPVVITYPSDGLIGAWTNGKMIENNGALLKNYYRVDAVPVVDSANYLLRSTDYGANWTTITVKGVNSSYYNESEIIGLGGDNLMIIARSFPDASFRQFYSDDNGLTWTDKGALDFGETWALQKPPTLNSFYINNQLIIAWYSFNQGTQRTLAVYAKASDLIAGTTGWNLNTKIQLLDTGPGNSGVGYGSIIHPDNTLRAIGNHYWAANNDETSTYYYTLPTTHYNSLIAELGL